jgi:hypothetical protein
MADIYNNATLTIMAASASDSQGGYFQSPSPSFETVYIPYTADDGATQLSISLRKPIMECEQTISLGPLFQRAWLFQERLMSKRKLLFGKEQLYWDCNGAVISESGVPLDVDEYTDVFLSQRISFRLLADAQFQDADGSSPGSLWSTLVLQFSRCSLTYENDRLPSLGGLARIFAQKYGYTYAAGLWLEDMPLSLLWRAHIPLLTVSKGEYCAPSWSWVSRQGKCYIPDESPEIEQTIEAEVLGADINLYGTDNYGKVTPGSKTYLRGRVRAVLLVMTSNSSYSAEGPFTEDNKGTRLGWAGLDHDRGNWPLPVFCVEIRKISYLDKAPHAEYLILHDENKSGSFLRLGTGSSSSNSPSQPYIFSGIEKTNIDIF